MTGFVELSYGRGHLSVALPDEASAMVIRKRPLAPLADPVAAIYLRCCFPERKRRFFTLAWSERGQWRRLRPSRPKA